MKFSLVTLAIAITGASAGVIETRQNANRPVPRGACCVANTSLKQDVCTTANGQPGRCVPDFINNCGAQLTCIAQAQLTCNPNQLERGRPFCRRTGVNIP